MCPRYCRDSGGGGVRDCLPAAVSLPNEQILFALLTEKRDIYHRRTYSMAARPPKTTTPPGQCGHLRLAPQCSSQVNHAAPLLKWRTFRRESFFPRASYV